MCIICDGGTFEELMSDQFVRIAMRGYVLVGVEGPTSWSYSIGLVRSFEHPELVMSGPLELADHALPQVVDRIRAGERFDASSGPVQLCDCTTVAFGSVDPAQWEHGRFDHWKRFYDWVGGDLPHADAVQVIWADVNGNFPPGADFCPAHRGSCQPLFDVVPERNVHSVLSREDRRRAKRARGRHRTR